MGDILKDDIYKEVLAANSRIQEHIRRTPLEYSPSLSELSGSEVYLKLENWQVTGSFKARGALNKLLRISNEGHKVNNIITASTGNHAAAVAFGLSKVRGNGIIFLPKTVAQTKVDKLKHYNGIELIFEGDDSVDAEKAALEYASKNDMTYVSPYNDLDVVAGQGTIGLEISNDGSFDAVLVPVGGGGLISGIGGYLKVNSSKVSIIGCQPSNSAVMFKSIKEGKVLEIPSLPTISDGTAGGVELSSITFDICRRYVDQWSLVDENEILVALRLLIDHHNLALEGAAGLALACLLKGDLNLEGKKVVLILCGRRYSSDLLKQILNYG